LRLDSTSAIQLANVSKCQPWNLRRRRVRIRATKCPWPEDHRTPNYGFENSVAKRDRDGGSV